MTDTDVIAKKGLPDMTVINSKSEPSTGSISSKTRDSLKPVSAAATSEVSNRAPDTLSTQATHARGQLAPSPSGPALTLQMPASQSAETAAPRSAPPHNPAAEASLPDLKYPPRLQRLSTAYGLKPGTSLTHDLQSPDPRVRLKGLKELEKASGNWDAYIAMVAHDSDPKVKTELLRVMLKHEAQVSPEVITRMITAELSPGAPADRRFLTLGLLSFIKTVDVGHFLKLYASDPDEKIRRSVVQTTAYRLESMSSEDIQAVLLAQMTSENPDHRLLVMELMAKKRSMPLSPYVAMCAGDPNSKLRKAMYRVMSDPDRFLTLSKDEARTIFAAEMMAPDNDRRLAAIKFMKTLPRFDARPLLQACLSDTSSSDKVKQAAQKVLKSLR